jgi:diguanylate cyclase (GGDEF)-like protein/PAS domain S-box-containing protein
MSMADHRTTRPPGKKRRLPEEKSPTAGLKSLDDSNRFSRTVIQCSPLAMIVLDTDDRIRMWNPAAEAVFGWKQKDVLGKVLPSILHDGQEPSDFKRLMDGAKSGNASVIQRTQSRRKNGDVLDVSISLALLQNKNGRAAGTVAIIADITEHKQTEDLYKTLADSSYAGVYVVEKGRFRFINSNAAAYAGYRAEEMLGMESIGFVHPDDRDAAKENAFLMLKGERSTPYEFRVIAKDGQIRRIMETVTPIRYRGKRAILGNSMDVTGQRETEQTLRENDERYRTIIENIEDGYYEVDLRGNFIFFNDACKAILGYEKDEMVGMNYRTMGNEETARKVFEIYQRVYTTGKPEKRAEWEAIKKDGSRAQVEASVSLIRDADGCPTGFRGIVHDITERKKAEEVIAYLAYHDALTGLPNRILFRDRLSVAIAQSKRRGTKFALLTLDLDQFKTINDTLGHSAGDRLLRSAGERLSRLLRKVDTVARMGGDEFVVLLEGMVSEENALTIAHKILRIFQKPFALDQHERTVTTSIGIAVYPTDGDNEVLLMKNADIALYRAKREGRNRCRRYLPLIDAELS